MAHGGRKRLGFQPGNHSPGRTVCLRGRRTPAGNELLREVLGTRNQQRRGCLQHRGRGPGGQHELRPVVLRDRLRKQDLLVPRTRRQQRQDLGFGQQGRALHRTRVRHHSRGGVRGRLRRRQAGRANAVHVPELPRHRTLRRRQPADRGIPRHRGQRLQSRGAHVMGNAVHQQTLRAQGMVRLLPRSH